MCKQYANCSYWPSKCEGIISNPSSAAMAQAVWIYKSTSPSEHGLKKKKSELKSQRTIQEFEFPFLYFKKGKELSQVLGHLNNFFQTNVSKRETKKKNSIVGVKKGKDGVKSTYLPKNAIFYSLLHMQGVRACLLPKQNKL